MKSFVGIDVGGTRLKAGLVGEDLRIRNETVVEVGPSDKTPEGLLARLVELAREVSRGVRPDVVGVGIPGAVDRASGVLTAAPNYPEVKDLALRNVLAARLECPVLVENDANCIAAGEHIAGAMRGIADFVAFTLGTGVGGALVLGGRLWRGADGMAGELGHLTVRSDGPPCGCGSRGCLEVYAGAVGLRRMVEAGPVPGVDPGSPDMPRQLSRAAAAGSPAARSYLEIAGRAMGQTIAGLLCALNVKHVLVAGGVAPAFFEWMQGVAFEEIRARTFPGIHAGVEIRPGTLGTDAGILGAAMHWRMDGEIQP